MFDEQSGWAVHQIYYPEDYKILRTTTGAASWKDVSPPAPAAQYSLDEVFFTDANTAIILVRKIPSVQTYDVEITPWRTTDGGQTWQAGEIIHTDRSIMAAIRGVEMIDAEHGWMLTEEDGAMQTAALHFFKTRDGGLHWDRIYSSVDHIGDPNILWGGGYSQFTKQFTFVTETLGFYEGSAITQDGGRSWSPITFELPGDLPEIDCHPGRIPCKFYRTRSLPQFTSSQDGVSLLRVYPNSEDVRDAFLYGDSSPLPLPAAQYVYYTHDGGQNWSITSAPALMGLLYFFDGQTGWFLGKDDPDPATLTQLYQTVDGGETWVKIVSDCPLLLGSHLQFVDAQNGFASGSPIPLSAYRNLDMRAGATHSIFITKDGGDTWQQVEPQLEP